MKAVLGRAGIQGSAGEIEMRQVISNFILRAYRGKGERLPEYVTIYNRLYQQHLRGSKDVTDSLFHVLEMILVSPEFLYRIESSQGRRTAAPVPGGELATRLAAGLGAGPPAEEQRRRQRREATLGDVPRQCAAAASGGGGWGRLCR